MERGFTCRILALFSLPLINATNCIVSPIPVAQRVQTARHYNDLRRFCPRFSIICVCSVIRRWLAGPRAPTSNDDNMIMYSTVDITTASACTIHCFAQCSQCVLWYVSDLYLYMMYE